MTAEVNGTELYYEALGSGRPLVMLHGNGEDHGIFAEAAGVLSQSYACFLPDSRGHGKSPYRGPLHYEDMARDVIELIEKLELRDVILYGFSDGGIVGLLAAARCSRITALIVSGANIAPEGLKPGLRLLFCIMYLFKKDPKLRLMLDEPHITPGVLRGISAKTLVLAGSRDLIRKKHTRQIAEAIPGARLQILKGEGHGTYIIHSTLIAGLIKEFVEE